MLLSKGTKERKDKERNWPERKGTQIEMKEGRKAKKRKEGWKEGTKEGTKEGKMELSKLLLLPLNAGLRPPGYRCSKATADGLQKSYE